MQREISGEAEVRSVRRLEGNLASGEALRFKPSAIPPHEGAVYDTSREPKGRTGRTLPPHALYTY